MYTAFEERSTRVPKGYSEGFCHSWHLINLRVFEKHTVRIRNIGEAAIEEG
jgi:hypothetical protein